MGLTIAIAATAFLCGMLLAGTIACFITGAIHAGAVTIVDTHLMRPGTGMSYALTTSAARRTGRWLTGA